MNFVFVSPTFPWTYWQFCDRLKERGVNVLAIGDTPYDDLSDELKGAVTEYYRVDSMENYDEMVKALGYFTYHYGRIDWLESNNEYWLEQDARLRTDFNIPTGFHTDIMEDVKCKSHMKKYYEQAGVKTARYHLCSDLDAAMAFVNEVGYPVIVKPDNGVGAAGTRRINNNDELAAFYAYPHDTRYIMEEFLEGVIESYEAIVNLDRDILIETSHMFPEPVMDIVNEGKSMFYYTRKDIPQDLLDYGRACAHTFPTYGRCLHMEFFRLTKDKPGLAGKGELVGLEVNFRMPGGYTPDMMNFASSADVYAVYADMVTSGTSDITTDHPYYCAYCGRRDGNLYKTTDEWIWYTYGENMRMHGRMPDILADAMGNTYYTAVFDTLEEVNAFAEDVLG